jgi:hypothetical protein
MLRPMAGFATSRPSARAMLRKPAAIDEVWQNVRKHVNQHALVDREGFTSMIKMRGKFGVIVSVLIACHIALILAEPASALSPSPPASASACIDFNPGASKPTDDGLATLDQVIKLFARPQPPMSVSVHVQFVAGEADVSAAAFRKNVSSWLDLVHARTREVIDRIVAGSDTVFAIDETVQPGGTGCPMFVLIRLPGGVPNLQCDKTSCHPQPN